MSVHHKKPRSAGLSVLVYDRGLHPELFTVDARRVRTLGGLDLSMCLLAGGGHLVGGLRRRQNCYRSHPASPPKPSPTEALLNASPAKVINSTRRPSARISSTILHLTKSMSPRALFDNSVTELLRLAEEQNGLVSHKKKRPRPDRVPLHRRRPTPSPLHPRRRLPPPRRSPRARPHPVPSSNPRHEPSAA